MCEEFASAKSYEPTCTPIITRGLSATQRMLTTPPSYLQCQPQHHYQFLCYYTALLALEKSKKKRKVTVEDDDEDEDDEDFDAQVRDDDHKELQFNFYAWCMFARKKRLYLSIPVVWCGWIFALWIKCACDERERERERESEREKENTRKAYLLTFMCVHNDGRRRLRILKRKMTTRKTMMMMMMRRRMMRRKRRKRVRLVPRGSTLSKPKKTTMMTKMKRTMKKRTMRMRCVSPPLLVPCCMCGVRLGFSSHL